MKNPLRPRRSLRLAPVLALAFALTALACMLCPARAMAAEVMAYSYDDSDNRVNYYTTDAALSAGYEGKVIYLDCDWNFTGPLTIADSKSITIEMNGHRIANNGTSEVIRMKEHSNLTLKHTGEPTKMSYTGYDAGDYGSKISTTVETGGLVTGGYNHCSWPYIKNTGGGIVMDAESTLTLNNVAVAGNYGDSGGGIFTYKNCNVNLENGAIIEHNSGYAGGIWVDGVDTNITLKGVSTIRHNYGDSYGGGIYSDADGTRIYLKENSSISYNVAERGGGVYFDCPYFNLVGDESGECEVSYNTALFSEAADSDTGVGGGIFVDSDNNTNEGSIENLKIYYNTAEADGGGIELAQEYTTVKNCSITYNKAYEDGGGIYVRNDRNTIDSCDIEYNICEYSRKYEDHGGGIYVKHLYDLSVVGKTIVKNNTSEDKASKGGEADNVYLAGTSTKAYLKGGVSKGSDIWVNTAAEQEDRQIGKDMVNETDDCIHVDTAGYRVAYDTSAKEVWQRYYSGYFQLSLNGDKIRGYAEGEGVNINATRSASDSYSAFWYWDEENTTGFADFSAVVKDIYNSALSFTMPQNDVSLQAVYTNRASFVTIYVQKPVVGEALSTTATLEWSSEGADKKTKEIPVAWYDADGNVATTAEYGKSYHVSISAEQDPDKNVGLFFRRDLSDVDFAYMDGDEREWIAVDTMSLDSRGTLNATSKAFEATNRSVETVDEAYMSVASGTTKEELLEALPTTAGVVFKDGGAGTLNTNKANIVWPKDLFDEDGKVITPASRTTRTVSLGLTTPDGVERVDDSLQVVVTIYPNTNEVLAPSLTVAGGTYSTASLTTGVYSPTEGATVYCQVGNEAARELTDPSAGVTLTGAQDAELTYTVTVWAEKDSLSSEKVSATYTLDNKSSQIIEVACSDMAYYKDGEKPWAPSFKVEGESGSSVTITAPAQTGRVFDHWEWAKAPAGTDLTQSSLVVNDFSSDLTGRICAVYAPVITTLDVDAAAPEADKALAKSAAIKAVTGTGATLDITSYVTGGSQQATLAWDPAGEADSEGSVIAQHDTVYTATVAISGDGSSSADVKYVLADDLKLLVGGMDVNGGAYVATAADGSKTLCITYPNTGPFELAEAPEVDGSTVSFADACDYQAAQNSGKDVDWDLPLGVGVTYECGCEDIIDITWNAVEGFDPTKLEAQTLTATGTIEYSSSVSTTASKDVSVTVTVEAPKAVEAPQATIASGTYAEAQQVMLGTMTDGATVRYTTDGTEPTEESPAYEGAIEVSESTTIKAKAFRSLYAPSETVTFTYTISDGTDPEPGPDPDPEPDTDPDQDPDAGTDPSDGSGDKGKDGDKALPQTGDVASIAELAATAGAVLAAAGVRRRK